MSEAPVRDPLLEMLIAHRTQLLGWVQREAGPALLRFESSEDLVQGVHSEALSARSRFSWQGHEAFAGWLFTIAERYLAGRRDHWFALKRNGANLLRLTWGGSDGHTYRGSLADTSTGPATFAFRREQMMLATKAVDLLLPRDRDIVQWCAAGASIEEVSSRLNVSIETAQRAKSRAIERLQKAYQLVSRASSSS